MARQFLLRQDRHPDGRRRNRPPFALANRAARLSRAARIADLSTIIASSQTSLCKAANILHRMTFSRMKRVIDGAGMGQIGKIWSVATSKIKVGKIVLISIIIAAPPHIAPAAELTPVSGATCDHLLRGEIKESDADLFKEAGVSRLCLDSPGGSFLGGQALKDLFMTDGIQTYVRRGDQCHSACALAFLGGSEWGDMRHASRTIEPGAVLGFHAPYLAVPPGEHDAEELNRSSTLMMSIAGKIVADGANLKTSLSFMTGFILYPSRETKPVATVHDAVMGGIEISTAYKLPKVTDKDARQACKTLFDRYSDAFADAVTATEPSFDVNPSGEFAKARAGTTKIDGKAWKTVSTENSNEAPWQSASCAFSDETDHWGYREAILWSNDGGSLLELKSANRRVRLRIPDWYFVPGDTPISKL